MHAPQLGKRSAMHAATQHNAHGRMNTKPLCAPLLGQGIGRATALLFAKKGFNVVVAARDLTKLEYVAHDCAQVRQMNSHTGIIMHAMGQ